MKIVIFLNIYCVEVFEYLLLFELDWEWAITMFAGEHGLGGGRENHHPS